MFVPPSVTVHVLGIFAAVQAARLVLAAAQLLLVPPEVTVQAAATSMFIAVAQSSFVPATSPPANISSAHVLGIFAAVQVARFVLAATQPSFVPPPVTVQVLAILAAVHVAKSKYAAGQAVLIPFPAV